MWPVSEQDCLQGPDPKHLPPPQGEGQIMNSPWSERCGEESLSVRQGLGNLASESSSGEIATSYSRQTASKCPRPRRFLEVGVQEPDY